MRLLRFYAFSDETFKKPYGVEREGENLKKLQLKSNRKAERKATKQQQQQKQRKVASSRVESNLTTLSIFNDGDPQAMCDQGQDHVPLRRVPQAHPALPAHFHL